MKIPDPPNGELLKVVREKLGNFDTTPSQVIFNAGQIVSDFSYTEFDPDGEESKAFFNWLGRCDRFGYDSEHIAKAIHGLKQEK